MSGKKTRIAGECRTWEGGCSRYGWANVALGEDFKCWQTGTWTRTVAVDTAGGGRSPSEMLGRRSEPDSGSDVDA